MKRRSHGKIDKLPLKLRIQVERKLINGETYAAISNYLKSLGFDIHLMSVFRYGKRFLKRYEAVKQAKSNAEVLLNQDNK